MVHKIYLRLASQTVAVRLAVLNKLVVLLNFPRTDLHLGPLLLLISPGWSDLLVFGVLIYCSLHMKAHGQRAKGKTSSLGNQFWLLFWLMEINTINGSRLNRDMFDKFDVSSLWTYSWICHIFSGTSGLARSKCSTRCHQTMRMLAIHIAPFVFCISIIGLKKLI